MLLSAGLARAQARWSRQSGGPGGGATALALDAASNAYVVGTFRGAARFGDVSLASVGDRNSFLAKYDAQGTVQWARQTGGNLEYAEVATDAAGNVYAVGTLSGSDLLNGQPVNSLGATDLLLVKYDPQGQVLWSQQGGSQPGGSLTGAAVALDGVGNAYVVGTLSGSVSWGGGALTSESGQNIYVASFSPQGVPRWARQAGGRDSRSRGYDVALDAAGSVYLSGSFSGLALVGASPVINPSPVGFMLAKCDATGQFKWGVAYAGGNSSSYPRLAVDAQGNSYLTGSTEGMVAGALKLTSAGGQDGYVLKHDRDGDVQWLRQVAGADTDYGTNVTLDAEGNVYTTGIFASAPTRWETTTLAHVGGKNAFIIKYNAQGQVLAAQREGACGGTYSAGIAVNAQHEIYLTGSFSGVASFVSTVFDSSAGGAFLAKAGDLTVPSTPDGFSCSSVAPPPAPTPPPTPAPTPPPTPTPTPTPTPIPSPPPAPTPAPAPAPPPSPEPEVSVPNIITPNGDGLNDRLLISGLTDNQWALTVYSRWGREVFATASYRQDWGAAGLAAGLYYYRLRHPLGRVYTGWVEVVR